ncbi:CbrC family protein [Sandaracinus amylolyticus]|uniref:Uncharacterized protein n=1 Tax=Sandaracinus amylolyticus TaxID=927083 RepID=A0A0F6YMJ4_9BACT|nr:CbrC family protein [Sandaracinus amylolyticus]AKF11422.1 hypothetical protein DB32_008571 [Sandaracinus amylolyticus]
MATFAELGISFPLYEGPLSTCTGHRGRGTCALCAQPGELFGFGIGGYVELTCAGCGARTDWHVAERVPSCACGAALVAPVTVEREVRACHACFRAGRAKSTQDTELGMVTPELARQGVTHGLPSDLISELYDTSPSPDDPSWSRVHVASELLEELLRTPTFSTWQGAIWLFHCDAPMVFVGEWKREELLARAGDDAGARRLVTELLGADDERCDPQRWDAFVRGEAELGGLYTFRCGRCGKHRAGWDMD